MTPSATPVKTPRRVALLLPLIVDFGLPLAVFYGLRAAGVDQWWSLLLSALVPAAVVVIRFLRSREIDFLALFVLSVVALSVGVSAMTGDPRTMLIRDAWGGLLGGLIGVWLLASVRVGRPALMYLFRAFVLAKVGPDGLRAWQARWDTDPAFRHGLRVITFVWGCASVVNVVVTLLAAYLLPLDLAPAVLNASWPVILVPTLIFHLYYTKKAGLRA
ncbi:VC0807 family protein [Actinoplanes oblitus]|uniref:VC0807 family protein n=1 Tax=Actinoplanes oblitus TaxID=3040509 RepID=A0ABY8W909_9ACTN|nr:VC0807 family protein [Actinoplanes oblitus]WIM94285.1 VC0807 family protein [Actinoplanes oblitus]